MFYLGLAAALGLYAIRFVWKLWKYAEGLLTASDSDSVLGLL